jgi:hypothetical protein
MRLTIACWPSIDVSGSGSTSCCVCRLRPTGAALDARALHGVIASSSSGRKLRRRRVHNSFDQQIILERLLALTTIK